MTAQKRTSESNRGVQRALRMLSRLERSMPLREACDPGFPEVGFAKPMRNILHEELLAIMGNAEALAGFALVLTAYLSMTPEGTPDISYLGELFRERDAFSRRATKARSDATFQGFLARVTSA